jgi:hypothetical protein
MNIEVGKATITLTKAGGGGGGTTDLEFNNVLQGQVTDGTTIEVNLEDPAANPVTPLSVGLTGNTLTIEIGVETPVEVNAVPVGNIPNGPVLFVNVEDSLSNPVTPTSVGLVGSILTIEVPTATPSGVLFRTATPDQSTSYRTGDTAWRLQNSWYDYTAPVLPAKVSALDFTNPAISHFTLKNPLTVAGVASTKRFVDVDGGQTFSSIGSKDMVVIDKLTGLMWVRKLWTAMGSINRSWNNSVDHALSYSVVVNGITYDDWYLPSLSELVQLRDFTLSSVSMLDGVTTIIDGVGTTVNLYWSANTNSAADTTRAMYLAAGSSRTSVGFGTKTDLMGMYFVRKAYNLIS